MDDLRDNGQKILLINQLNAISGLINDDDCAFDGFISKIGELFGRRTTQAT